MDPVYLFSHGLEGSNIEYSAAVSTRRKVYASPGAQASMPELVLLLRSITEGYRGAPNNWKYLTSAPTATDLHSKTLLIVSEEEKTSDWSANRYALPMIDFLDYVMKINFDMTSSGLCGH